MPDERCRIRISKRRGSVARKAFEKLVSKREKEKRLYDYRGIGEPFLASNATSCENIISIFSLLLSELI